MHFFTTKVIGQNEYTPAWDTFSPAWTDATTPFSLSENAAVGTTIVTIKANDDDDGTDGAISFELGAITSGTLHPLFLIS